MKQQTTALLFSALLFSTFAHDALRARQHAPAPAVRHENQKSRLLSHFQARDTPLEAGCVEICTVPLQGLQGVTVTINVTGNVFGAVNVTTEYGIILDYSAGIVAVVNGNTGAILLWNLVTQKGVYVSASVSTSIGWLVSKVTFTSYVSTINLTLVFQQALTVGASFTLSTITSAEGSFILTVIQSLDSQIIETSSTSLNALIVIVTNLSTALRVVGGLISSNTYSLAYGILGVSRVIQGLYTVLLALNIPGGISVLLSYGIFFDVAILVNQSNSASVFIYILEVLQASININGIISNVLNVNVFFALAAELAATTDFVVVVSEAITLVSYNGFSDSLLRQFIISLITYVGENLVGSANVTEQWDDFQASLNQLTVVSTVAASSSFVQELQAGNLVLSSGVNISELIQALVGISVTFGIETILAVLYIISVDVSLKITIIYLLFELFLLLGNSVGVLYLTVIFPAIQFSFGAFIASLVAFVATALLTLNFYAALVKLAIIGPIVLAVQSAINAVASVYDEAAVSIQSTISANSTIKSVFVSVFNVLIKGGADVTVTTSVSTSSNVSVSGSWSSVTVSNSTSYSAKLLEYAKPIHEKHRSEKEARRHERQHVIRAKKNQVHEKRAVRA